VTRRLLVVSMALALGASVAQAAPVLLISVDARIAVTLIQLYRPGFITVHFGDFDCRPSLELCRMAMRNSARGAGGPAGRSPLGGPTAS